MRGGNSAKNVARVNPYCHCRNFPFCRDKIKIKVKAIWLSILCVMLCANEQQHSSVNKYPLLAVELEKFELKLELDEEKPFLQQKLLTELGSCELRLSKYELFCNRIVLLNIVQLMMMKVITKDKSCKLEFQFGFEFEVCIVGELASPS